MQPPPGSPGRLSEKRRKRASPVLRFSPAAWAKLLFFRDAGAVEIGGFGITAPDDPLNIREFVTLKQEVSSVTVEFDDEAVADLFEDQVDRGLQPHQFARIWLHTHPGNSPHPSGVDEATFRRVFGGCDWAVMFILAQGGDVYARLQFNAGPGGSVEIPVEVDYATPFEAPDFEAWIDEYDRNVHERVERFADWKQQLSKPSAADAGDSPHATKTKAAREDFLLPSLFDGVPLGDFEVEDRRVQTAYDRELQEWMDVCNRGSIYDGESDVLEVPETYDPDDFGWYEPDEPEHDQDYEEELRDYYGGEYVSCVSDDV